MSSRIQTHKLSNGLYVSGRPETPDRENPPTMAVPYTGGNIENSGELGRMFDVSVTDHSSSRNNIQPPSRSVSNGSARSGPNSGRVVKKSSGSFSQLQPTGLITSGSLGSSGPLNLEAQGSGQLDHHDGQVGLGKPKYGSAVTSLTGNEASVGFRVPKAMIWVFLVIVAMGLLVGAFLMATVKKKVVVVVAMAAVLVPAAVGLIWNCVWGQRGLLGFVRRYSDTELRAAIDGQFVKVTGVVTCGSIPLESSYQKVPRCVYVSTELYEYRGFCGQSANANHRCFSWGSRFSERYVADFYISDFQSGLRALVKAGYGSKVSPFVKPSTVLNVTNANKDMSPGFLTWLSERNLSTDNRAMRLKERYIKEGSTISVTGVVRRHDNVLMIAPPAEPVSTGCHWLTCILPSYAEGLILTCEGNQDEDVVPV